jgi:integrase
LLPPRYPRRHVTGEAVTRALTDITIRNLRAEPKRREIPDPGARGLYVIVQPSGIKSFAVRYRFAGASRKLTLQSGITLAAARKAAADALYQLDQGHDPSTTRRQARHAQRLAAGDAFKAVAEEYERREGLRLRSTKWRRGLLERLVLPTLGDRPIGDIRRSEIIRLLANIEEGAPLGVKGGPVAANRALAIIRRIMNWHAARSDDFRSPIVRGMARAGDVARTRILTDDELRAVWSAADAGTGPFDRLVQFLLLTAARRTEAAAMTWQEIDGSDWVLPAARNKTNVDLTRPLSAAAQAVLARVPRLAGCPFVFSTDGRSAISGFAHFKTRFDVQCGVTGWTLHDLRRTARSLMSRAGVNSDHAERCLGHVIGGVRGVYDRHEFHAEKLRAFEALAAQIDRILNPRDNVAVLPARG